MPEASPENRPDTPEYGPPEISEGMEPIRIPERITRQEVIELFGGNPPKELLEKLGDGELLLER